MSSKARQGKARQGKADFPITYHFQPNSGKHVAFNQGVQLAQGECFLNADSDDRFFPNALQCFWDTWQSIPDPQNFSGVTALCVDHESQQIIGDQYAQDPFDSNTLETSYRLRIRGEKWGFQRTEVLRKFPFPELEGVKFIPESIVWTQLARHYTTRYINTPLQVYYQNDPQSLASSVTRHPRGMLEWHLHNINNNADYLSWSDQFWECVHCVRMAYYANFGSLRLLQRFQRARWLWLIALAPGYLAIAKKALRRSSNAP